MHSDLRKGGDLDALGSLARHEPRAAGFEQGRFLQNRPGDIPTSSLDSTIQLDYVACLLHCELGELGNHLEYVAIRTCNLDSTAAKLCYQTGNTDQCLETSG